MFAFFLAGLVGFAVFGRGLLIDYVAISVVSFLFFYTLVPWIPTKFGWTRALVLDLLLGGALVATELLLDAPAPRPRADLIIAMSMIMLWGSELGGLSSTMGSDFDPMMARFGVKAIGNVAFAGTLRTDLLNGLRDLTHDPARCTACGQCYEVCPIGVWDSGQDGTAVLARRDECTGCTACVYQCTDGAIRAPRRAALG
ncbi:MAG: 4Fe-4S binding protein [Myxococcota bacterium]|jgi:NAD-dependent dihydropyrimidine dehydrogenase PreA subunit|nr:4Fe-4S binding protein [Myxococcota bacterium]